MRSPQPYARLCGALYLVIIAGGVFAEAFVRGRLVVSGDPGATAAHIVGAQALWRVGLASELVMLVCDVAVAVLLYGLLRPVSQILALLGAGFRLVQVAISGLNGLAHLAALLLLTGPPYLGAFSEPQLQAAALFSLKLQSTGYDIALVFFGIDCLVVGFLVSRARYLPLAIGLMMVVAGACYLASSFAAILSPPASTFLYHHGVLLPPLIAELSFAVWLTVMGVNLPRWRAICGEEDGASTPAERQSSMVANQLADG